MNDANPPLKQLNRTFIGSVLFIDIVGYSMRTVPDQLEMKELFNRLLGDAVQNVAASERIMVDTGDGAGIAFLGDPEDALFAALALRDAIEARSVAVGEPGFVRMGINLGPLKIVRDINGHTNMIGDGVNDAQRVMSFADPGQVMVSHSYYDIISRFSRDYTQLFVYEGTRHDKHVREHEVYRFGPARDGDPLAQRMRERSRARDTAGAEAAETLAAAAPGAAASAAAGAVTTKKSLPRAGLIASVAGVVLAAGAVWSWTSRPEQPQQVQQVQAVQAAAPQPAEKAERAQTLQQFAGTAPAAAATAAAPAPSPEPEPAKERTREEAREVKAAGKPVAAEPARASDAAARTADAKEEAPPAKPGTVKFAVQPWGEIYVDGSRRGVSPPMKSLSLAPGKHRIEIRNGEFTPYKESVEVKSGGQVTVQYVF